VARCGCRGLGFHGRAMRALTARTTGASLERSFNRSRPPRPPRPRGRDWPGLPDRAGQGPPPCRRSGLPEARSGVARRRPGRGARQRRGGRRRRLDRRAGLAQGNGRASRRKRADRRSTARGSAGKSAAVAILSPPPPLWPWRGPVRRPCPGGSGRCRTVARLALDQPGARHRFGGRQAALEDQSVESEPRRGRRRRSQGAAEVALRSSAKSCALRDGRRRCESHDPTPQAGGNGIPAAPTVEFNGGLQSILVIRVTEVR